MGLIKARQSIWAPADSPESLIRSGFRAILIFRKVSQKRKTLPLDPALGFNSEAGKLPFGEFQVRPSKAGAFAPTSLFLHSKYSDEEI